MPPKFSYRRVKGKLIYKMIHCEIAAVRSYNVTLLLYGCKLHEMSYNEEQKQVAVADSYISGQFTLSVISEHTLLPIYVFFSNPFEFLGNLRYFLNYFSIFFPKSHNNGLKLTKIKTVHKFMNRANYMVREL